MSSMISRRSILVLVGFILGSWFGYFFCSLLEVKPDNNTAESREGVQRIVYQDNKNKVFSNNGSNRQLGKSGVVYDCLTWEVRHTYNADQVNNEYQQFPEILDGAEGDAQRQKSFVEIYHKQLWLNEKDTMIDQSDPQYRASGPGATLQAAQGVLAVIHTVIDKLKHELNKTRISILDLPCGDLQWMSYLLQKRSDIDYTGMDIVPELIDKHKRTYADKPNIHFKHFDIVKSKLDGGYDFIICRMMLQHLLNDDVLKALSHFSSSDCKYFGATTFPDVAKNEELIPLGGRLRFLNLEKPPINVGPPVCTYPEPAFPSHHFAIWKLPLLQRSGEKK